MSNKIKDSQTRFKDAQWFNPNLDIIIAGLGGTGSHVNYILCRQGYETYIFDHDSIDIENIGSQMYSIKDIGKKKTEKAAEIAAFYDNTNYHIFEEYTEDSLIGNIVFACFDSMSARKLIFEKWVNYQLSKTPEHRKENPNEVNIYLEGRMSAENIQVFSVKTLKEIEVYKTTLFDDNEIEPLPCSYKATCQTGTMIGSLMSMIFLNHVANKNTGIKIRETPFCIKYDNASMMYRKFNIENYVTEHK